MHPVEERHPGGILDSSLSDDTSSTQWHTTRFYTLGHSGSKSSWKVDYCPRTPNTIVEIDVGQHCDGMFQDDTIPVT